jgi:predicted phosphodiesterase
VRVAALYDVHGNLPALEAVLDDVRAESVDAIVFGGDIASGPFPRETVDRVRSLDVVCVRGNADVLSSPAASPEWEPARRWVEAQLDDGAVAWLETLPFAWSCDDTLYVHANPVDVDGVVTQWSRDEKLVGLLEGVQESRVVTGHVHMQFDRRVGRTRWVGAGSVGMPYESMPGAYWTLLEPGRVRFMRTGYDLEAAAAAIRASGYPGAEELAAENVLTVPSRAEVEEFFARYE